MNDFAIRKLSIINRLAKVPKDKLREVEAFISSILSQTEQNPEKAPKFNTLGGIWKDKGIEALEPLENNIQQLRKNLDSQIEDRI